MFHPVSFQGERVQKSTKSNNLCLNKNNNNNDSNWTITVNHPLLMPLKLSSSLGRVLLIGAKEVIDDGFIVLSCSVRLSGRKLNVTRTH